MTLLLPRLGALEARFASQTLWSSGKRKRGDWICAECRNRRALKQRRAYTDDALRITPDQYMFPARDTQNEENEDRGPVRRVPLMKKTQLRRPRAWGWAIDDTAKQSQDVGLSKEADQVEDQHNSLWEQFEQVDEANVEQAPIKNSTQLEDVSSSNGGGGLLLDVEYATELPKALTNNAPDMVARCLFSAARHDDLEFIRSIPNTTFTECIRQLQPSNFTQGLANAHMEISEATRKIFHITSMQKVAWEHTSLLQEILVIRRSIGIKFGLEEYRMLLAAARDLGSKRMANKLWMDLHNDGLIPDTACYNYYMAASVWNGIHVAADRHKTRVIPFTLLARRAVRLGRGFSGYAVGDGGLKAKVLKIFSEMLKVGATADEESFCNVITAAAREGDMITVKSVLRKVWDIDVDGLYNAEKNSIESTPVDKSSPFRPTSKLLFTIAHAFGINNNIPAALRVTDFIARRHDIPISLEVWSQLFEWTFVLATPRTGLLARKHGTNTGQLPKQSVLSLWDTMTGAPYFVKPTMGMYNHLIKNLQHRDSPQTLYGKMKEGWEIYSEHRRRAHKAFQHLKREAEKQENDPDTMPSIPLETLRREWEYLDLVRLRDVFWICRWLRLLLSTTRASVRTNQYEDVGWSLCQIPTILWEWRAYAPKMVRYETSGGVVEILMRTEEEMDTNRWWKERRSQEIRTVVEKVPLFVGDEWTMGRHRRASRRRWRWERNG